MMRFVFGWLSTFLLCAAFAEEDVSFSGEVAKNEKPSALQQNMILQKLNGILLLGDWNLVRNEPVSEISGIQVQGVHLLAENKPFLSELAAQFVGEPLTQARLAEIKQKISDFYAAEGQPLVVVSTPKQEVTKGTVQIVVKEAKLGEIRCKGNRYFNSGQLKKYIRAKPGEPIPANQLLQDLAFMNQSPFRRTDAVFTPGKKAGIADLELLTVDRWPYRFYAGADNTGTISTERNRLFLGFNFGKTIVPDSEVSYQYTTAPNGNRYFSHSGMLRVPIPWIRHTIQAFGGYASVEPDSGVSSLKPKGISWSVDLRYRIPLGTTELLQDLVVGYDFKESNTNLHFHGKSDFYGLADINQFMIGYDVGVRNRKTKISLNLEVYGSPGHITNHDNDASYQTLRYAAKAAYVYAKLTHNLSHEFSNGCRFSYNLSGQAATTNLLPSEQFTMTGFHAVRGFEERILNLDNAGLLNVSFESPHFSPAHWMGWCRHYDDLSFLAFFDTGVGGNHQLTPGENSLQSLGSIGPSVRYELSRYFSAHLDYGFQLWHSGFDPITNSRYNFGLIFSY